MKHVYPRGVDVSVRQGRIDWQRVQKSGVTFAMIKATQGRSESNSALRLFRDARFTENLKNAATAGITCGVYHYLTAATVEEAKQEAAYFLSIIRPHKARITGFAAVDVESDRYLPKDKEALTAIVKAFCDAVAAGGFAPMVYTNPNYLRYRLKDISAYPLWLALWRSKTNIPTKKDYPSLTYWQWGSETVSGIKGKTDANLDLRELPTTEEYADAVCKAAGLAPATRAYLSAYRYGADLWKKLYRALHKTENKTAP